MDAPVVMVVYSDYQCPFCAVWAEQTQPTMLEYVESGDLRIEWRDIAVFGPDSERAARAAYAAGLQGAFWEFHDALFAGGEKRAAADLTEEALVTLAGALDLDPDVFRADLASVEVDEAVKANADEAAAIGAFSTPSFLVNEQAVVGAQPTEVFIAAVEDALARAAG
ncbi:thioredoxin domain-containing protein [Actinotalea sp. K2]|uniref:DsbA family protein n=1 Tax=Actinotalea sp. K2 TaxID=2939438 RepID=UPI002017F2F8|nr:thioredoxin domain-containing protein [Actinotalea sp. K2]MCL3862276.1 thioredoxin domain-containing protein [Actinotalea sp. K2]